MTCGMTIAIGLVALFCASAAFAFGYMAGSAQK